MTDATQEWRAIPGFEGLYEVSDQGNVRSLDRLTTGPSGVTRQRRGRLLRINYATNYPQISLCKNGEASGHSIHRLVAKAFLGIPENSDELHVCHYDGDRTNNWLSNLRWDTPTGNYEDMKRHGRVRMNDVSRAYPVCNRGHAMTPENTVTTVGPDYTKNRCAKCNELRLRARQAKALVERLTNDLQKAQSELQAATDALA